MLCVGTTEAPFAVAHLAAGEDVELRIFVDKYLVEVFANGRQAVVTAYMGYQAANGLRLYSYGGPATVKRVVIQRMRSTTQGFFAARQNGIWEPQIS